MARRPSKKAEAAANAATSNPAPETPAFEAFPVPGSTAAIPAGVNVALLRSIVDATNQPPGWCYANGFDLVPLETLDLVEASHSTPNPDDPQQLPVRAKPSASAYLDNIGASPTMNAPVTPPAVAAAVATAKPVYEIDNYPLPPRKRRGPTPRPSVYPFETLELGQTFHIPVSDANGATPAEVCKKFASTVSSANQRYATETRDEAGNVVTTKRTFKGVERDVPVWTYSRKFSIDQTIDGDPRGPGARVGRLW